jgi:hypothetical protein
VRFWKNANRTSREHSRLHSQDASSIGKGGDPGWWNKKLCNRMAGMVVPDDFRLTGLTAFAMPFIKSIT